MFGCLVLFAFSEHGSPKVSRTFPELLKPQSAPSNFREHCLSCSTLTTRAIAQPRLGLCTSNVRRPCAVICRWPLCWPGGNTRRGFWPPRNPCEESEVFPVTSNLPRIRKAYEVRRSGYAIEPH